MKTKITLLLITIIMSLGYRTYSSTGDAQILITGGNSNSMDIIFERVGYISYWDHLYPGSPYTIYKAKDFPQEYSVTLINEILTNLTYTKAAIVPGNRAHIHNNRAITQMFNISTVSYMMEGIVISADTVANTVTLKYKFDNGYTVGSAVHVAYKDTTLSYSDNYVFRYEGKDVSEGASLQIGKHVRVYKPRKQIVMSYTPEALNFTHTYHEQGGAQYLSFPQEGFLRGFDASGNAYFAEYRNGKWMDVVKGPNSKDNTALGTPLISGQYIDNDKSAVRMGERVTFVPYCMPHIGYYAVNSYVRANDENTVEGWIKSINGSQVTLSVIECPTGYAADVDTVEKIITIDTDAEYHHNGIQGSLSTEALKVGNYVRIKQAWNGAVLGRSVLGSEVMIPAEHILPYFVSTDGYPEIRIGLNVFQQADTVKVTENEIAHFGVFAFGTGTINYQWYKNGFKVPGASSRVLDIIVYNADDGAVFTCVATNAAGSTTSNDIILKVNADTTPLTILGASIADRTTIQLSFNKAVKIGQTANSAELIANYAIDNGINITSAVVIGDKKTVILTTDSLQSGTTYTITVNNVNDLSETPNQIATNSTTSVNFAVTFRYLRYQTIARGSLNPNISEMTYFSGGTAYGPSKTYFGSTSANLAFDQNFVSSVSAPPGTFIGVDMGAGLGISPDSVRISLASSNGRNVNGFFIEASNDQINWTEIMRLDSTLINGNTYNFPFDLSSLNADDILTGAKQPQTITFPAIADKDMSESPVALNASSDKSLPITYFVLAGPATLIGKSLILTDTGIVVVRAVQSGNDSIHPAYPVETSFHVSVGAKQAQTISFGAISDQLITNDSIILSATSTSGLTVSFEVISGAASIFDGNILYFLDKGDVTIEATQIGNIQYLEATPVQQTFNVYELPTGIKTAITEKDINVWPNPTTGLLYFDKNVLEKITVYNLLGNEIIEVEGSSEIDISNLSSGLYIIKVGKSFKRIIKK